ncbi:ABC transporter substrate-binding protein [Oceanobacter sp. 4_MG-2023]|uniref:ABC transporter substrate-binding protein n=1 Tax=Oceanobacter sp. 4_MG-2023 TaxID=3062623 RepID=UPI002736653D|nr:ABC transporter substrate-binding protein [Oceanobacter sp. 4_MG-2023]MDP2548406.1 ABC transporter substrate-binding protein [Oceanobacter sp. 4_MG-2023]
MATRHLILSTLLAGSALTALAGSQGEGRVDIIAWPGYIERGDTDPAYDWVSGFEQSTGCSVNVKTAATSDEMVSLMAKGGYDLVTASGDASLRLIYGKRVQPIDTSKIKAWSSIDPRLQNAPWFTLDGKHYGVPFQWGPNLMMYNTDVFKQAPDSWSVVFEATTLPDGQSNKGRVQAYDGAIYLADAALYLKSARPELGIKDPYELNKTQYSAVLALLRTQHSLIHRYWHDYNVQMSDFKNEGVVASSSWPFMANILIAEGAPVATAFPQEGVTGWADTTMLATDAAHPNCAYEWLNWSITPKLQGDLASWFGSVPAVPAACDNNALLGAEGCTTNGMDNFDQVFFWKTPTSNCSSQGSCVSYSRWTRDYIAIMGGR